MTPISGHLAGFTGILQVDCYSGGGERAVMMYSLVGIATLNGVDPLAWLTDILVRIADPPQSRLHELLPMKWIRLREAPFVQETA